MAPRRSQAATGAVNEGSSSALLHPDLAIDRLSSALSSWNTDGQDIVKQVLSNQTGSETVSASTIPISNSLIKILQSEIGVEEVTNCLQAVTESWETERKDVLWEALVDSVAVLSEAKDDSRDLKPTGEGMEVDDQTSLHAADKGIQVIKSLLASNTIPAAIPSLMTSPAILAQLGLIPHPHTEQSFGRSFVKRSTALFYKQSKYNLLRESSEGFSGLIVLLTSRDALVDDSLNETETEVRARAQRVWAKIMGLIGYFNLSPPRVLDIILEIASCHVAAHWRFWLELIRASPWGGVEKSSKGKEKMQEHWSEQELAAVGGVLQWDGDRVLAQVLGAKFGSCQRPDGGDTPLGLVYMAALLVRHGFVGLADLLPFLSPNDDEMESIRQKFIESTVSRSGPNNALANSVLVDDDPPSSSSTKDTEPSGPPAKPPPEQRIQLLQALLSLGDIASAQYFLAKYPWTAQSHPAISDLILRLIATALEGVFREEVPGFEVYDETLNAAETNSEKEVVPTLYAPSPPETSTKVFRFFYPDWRNDAEKWTTWQDIHDKGLRWFSLVRGMGGRAGSVMAKICRIGIKHFVALRASKEAALGISHGTTKRDELRQVEPTPAEMEPWISILRVLLLPALSNSSATAPFDIDLWALIKHFPYAVRYQLYGEWRDFTCDPKKASFNCPIAVKAAADCTRDIKKALSRVTASQSSALPSSQERGPARALAKLSHTNPCSLWATAVTQVKAYPNIGASIVDAGRYMNQLAMDVATFTLVDVLASEKGSRTNPQGTEVAQWLENIAAFVGDFNRRYSSMDLEPILQYIINKLMRGESDDLTILSRVIQRMYGVDTVENNGVSDAQLEAYATGKAMVHESFWTTQILLAKPTDDPANKAKTAPTDKTKNTKKSLPRLISALRDTKLAIPIWIALAQTRQGVVDKLVERQPDTPLKALGLMHDKVHDIFIQYGDLLGEQLTGEELIRLVPDFATLTNDFGLDHSMAFQVIRPRLHAQIVKEDGDKLAQLKERLMAQKEAIKANGAGGAITPPLSPVPLTPPLSPRVEETIKELGVSGDVISGITVPEPRMSAQRGKYHPALQITMEQASRVLSEHALDIMGAPFFVAFWQMSMSDIAFSAHTYSDAIARIKAYDKEVGSWKGGSPAAQREERRRLMDQCDLLVKERDSQSAYVERTRKRLRTEAPTWFQQEGNEKTARNDLAQQLHQYCFYPRALLTPADAVYVPRLIRLLHDIGTPGFTTVFAYLHFFQDALASCIFACTESEARNLARCIKTILVDVDSWHKDEKKYEREALGKVDDTSKPTLSGMLYQPKANLEPRHMIWTGFRTLVFKFHTGLFKAIKSCWEQKDFMHVKNGITVALQVLPIFPLIEEHGKELYRVMEVLEKRSDLTPDLKQGCKAYMVQLKKRTFVRPYVPEDNFKGAPKIPAPAPASGNTTAKAPPSGPARAANGQPPAPLARAASTAGTTTATSKTLSEQEALRQKVKETRAKTATSNVKEARRSAPPAGPSAQSGESKAAPVEQTRRGDTRDDGKPPPAGPRSTRATASVPPAGPAANARARGTPDRTPAAPSGPAKTSSPAPNDKPASSTAATNSNSEADQAEKARLDARAARFRGLESNPPTAPAGRNSSPAAAPSVANTPGRDRKPDTPMGPPATKKEDGRDTPQTRSPRRPSSPAPGPGPSTRTRRSGSVESRTSDRSRTRSTRGREQEDRERDKIRAERNAGTGGAVTGSRPSTPVKDAAADTSEAARKKQEEILQARHEKLASEAKSGDRRSSSLRREKETEQERAERKAREKAEDRDRERDKDKPHDDAGTKRKRDEAPRIIDPLERPGDRRRSDREKRDRDDRRHDDRDRGHDRDRDRRETRHNDTRDSRDDRRNDPQDRRTGPRDARDEVKDRDRSDRRNDGRDRDRERDRPRDARPDDRERDRTRDVRSDERDRDRDARRRPNDRELLPAANAAAPSRSRDQSPRNGPVPTNSSVAPIPTSADRPARESITAPVTHPLPQPPARPAAPSNPRQNESPSARAPHALPARPGMRSENNGTPIRGAASPAPGSLASRMGPAVGASSPGPARPRSPPNPPPADQPTGNGVGAADTPPPDLKRPHDDVPQLAREGSAEIKRRKIVREKARRDDGSGSGGTGRLLAGAMRAAHDK